MKSLKIFSLLLFTIIAPFPITASEEQRQLPDGKIKISGQFNENKLNHSFSAAAGILSTNEIKIMFSVDPNQESIYNLKGIDIFNLDGKNLPESGLFVISDKAEGDNQITADINLDDTCGDIQADSGILNIRKLNTERFSGQITMKIQSDKIDCEFDIPLMNNIPQVYLPVTTLDGTKMDLKDICDKYPDNKMTMGQVTFLGEVKNIKMDNKVDNGYMSLGKLTMEINAQTNNELKKIELEMTAYFIDQKIRVGTFRLLPIPKELTPQQLMGLRPDEFFAEWEDYHPTNPAGDDSPVEGTITISAYAENGIAGNFEITVLEKDGSTGHVSGDFKLPFEFQ